MFSFLVVEVQARMPFVIRNGSCCFRDICNGIFFQRQKYEAGAAETRVMGPKGQGKKESENESKNFTNTSLVL